MLISSLALFSQPRQTHRYELEKKNTDDYFNVLPLGNKGAFIFRDTNDYDKGDVWNIVALDTTLAELWNIELSIDSKYVLKGYDTDNSKLYLLFREGEYEKRDYHLMTVDFTDSSIIRYDIKNEIPLVLSHMNILPTGMILGGYVNFSPTLMLYTFGEDNFTVVPGFFKDRSSIVDLADNGNNTFNIITLEKDYEGGYLRLRTYGYDGTMLFEREIKTKEGVKILGAKSSGFIDGNIIIAGTYGMKNSNYASGIYVAIAKPIGQDNLIKYHNLFDLEHFFDYMRPKRAARLKAKMERRNSRGKEVNYSSRLSLNNVTKTDQGYLISAEIFNPRYDRRYVTPGYAGFDSQQEFIRQQNRANQNYMSRPSELQNVDNVQMFKYLESIVVEVNKKGDLIWDNSMKIEDMESSSLDQVTALSVDIDEGRMLYLSEEEISYKVVEQSETVEEGLINLRLKYEYDEIISTYDGVGRGVFWYENCFLVWGFHRVGNKVQTEDKNRTVLYINKVVFD